MKRLLIAGALAIIFSQVIPQYINESTGIDVVDDMVLYVKSQKSVVAGAVLYTVLIVALTDYLIEKTS